MSNISDMLKGIRIRVTEEELQTMIVLIENVSALEQHGLLELSDEEKHQDDENIRSTQGLGFGELPVR